MDTPPPWTTFLPPRSLPSSLSTQPSFFAEGLVHWICLERFVPKGVETAITQLRLRISLTDSLTLFRCGNKAHYKFASFSVDFVKKNEGNQAQCRFASFLIEFIKKMKGSRPSTNLLHVQLILQRKKKGTRPSADLLHFLIKFIKKIQGTRPSTDLRHLLLN